MDRLDRELGRDLVFMDVDAIPLGTNFSKVLHEEVAKCGVLLAMIGPNWPDARDEDTVFVCEQTLGNLQHLLGRFAGTEDDLRKTFAKCSMLARSTLYFFGSSTRSAGLVDHRTVSPDRRKKIVLLLPMMLLNR